MYSEEELAVFSFEGTLEPNHEGKIVDCGGIYSTRNKLIGGEQIAEIAFYVTIPAAIKYISETVREIIRSRRVDVTFGDDKFENISEDQLDDLIKVWKKRARKK